MSGRFRSRALPGEIRQARTLRRHRSTSERAVGALLGTLSARRPGGRGVLAAALVAASLVLPAAARAQQGARLPLTWENLFTRATGVRQAVLSPDGSTVAVAASTVDGSGIFLVPVDGVRPPRMLVQGGTSPVWMPDGTGLLFSARGDLWIAELGPGGGGSAVEVAPLRPGEGPEGTGTGLVRVTDDADAEGAARPSPDGQTIVFYSTRSGHRDIWLVPADGSSPARPLTRGSMASDDVRFAPAWSPDGTTIAYFSNRSDYWSDDIWIVDVASGRERQVSRGLMASSTPVWSPDGSRIALIATSKDEYWYEDLAYLYVLDPETGSEDVVEMQVDATDWLHNLGVFWSDDGSELFFPYLERARMELWRVPAAGGVATRITNMGGHFRG